MHPSSVEPDPTAMGRNIQGTPRTTLWLMRVGLLAYGAIGHEHNLAVQATDGLELTAVCDTDPARIAAAHELAPDAAPYTDALQMLDSGNLDLVVISTPPNTHFEWAKAALEQNLHVVLEKPMALTVEQCDTLLELADQKDRTLVVFQNRRFDPDFVTMRRIIQSGDIGDVFEYNSFVGGYSRPCDYWHSDADVSGGAIFDWGSHYIDQILNLFDQPIDHVTGVNHKRHWMHATNADHAEVVITFVDGTRASFIHSDLSAARKPKFHVLATQGAVVAEWDAAAEPAVADLPAKIFHYNTDGQAQSIPLDDVPAYAFHSELAAYLRTGAPMQVSAKQSRNVVAIMEAAEDSARHNGRPVVPDLLP
jgi:scyllo-inositol 2-dehydrogenase (NADP+)